MELAKVIKSIIFLKKIVYPGTARTLLQRLIQGIVGSRPLGGPGTMIIHQTNSPLLRIVLTEDAEGLVAGIQAILAQGLI